MSKTVEKLLDNIKKNNAESSVTIDEADFLIALIKLIKARVVVETGTKYGYSAIKMATTGVEVHSVDIKKGGKAYQEEQQAKENVKKSKLSNLSIYTCGSIKFLETFSKPIDLLFLDSLHTVEHVRNEIRIAKMSEKGIIVIHDALRVKDMSEDLSAYVSLDSGNGLTILTK